MKYIYTIKEYLRVLWLCLKYIYRFDKKGTIARLGVLMLFPAIANVLSIANAKLADQLQQNFGTGVIGIILPIFFVIIGLQILDETFDWISRRINWVWRSKMRVFVDIERHRKKSNFTIPFIDSEDYDTLNQRIMYSGSGFQSQMNIITNIPTLIRILINSTFAAGIIFSFNPLFSLIILISAIPGFSVSFTQQFAMRKNWEKNLMYQRITGVYGDHFAHYTALKDTKTSGSAFRMLDVFKDRKEWNRQDQYKVWKKYINISYFANLVAVGVAFFVEFFVLKEAINGYLLIGQTTLITMQIFRLQGTLQELSWFLPDQYENVTACKYLFLYLETTENTEKLTGTKLKSEMEKGIQIQNVTFTYPEVKFNEMRKLNEEIDKISEKYFGLKMQEDTKEEKKKEPFLLQIDNLSMYPGERIAIVGKNGNGKTTLIQLLLNLYQPTTGTVSIFGNDTKETAQFELQKYYSALFQDYANSSLKAHEYIALSEIDAPDMDRVKEAAKLATADEFIEKWKDGYIQQLGVSFKGVKPSKGQWQKLALARTFYKNAPIVILDEPTAAIDAISAKKIFENISKIDPSKIVLFVCHNISDIPLAATRVLVFDQGKIIGDGTHEVLLRTCELYKELYQSEKGS